jgi:hypothetical protein
LLCLLEMHVIWIYKKSVAPPMTNNISECGNTNAHVFSSYFGIEIAQL